MRPVKNTKRLIKNAKIVMNPKTKEAALKDLISELKKSDKVRMTETHPKLWRIMSPSFILGKQIIKRRGIQIAAGLLGFFGLACLIYLLISGSGNHGLALAQTWEQMATAKTITWKTTFYSHVTSRDGERAWIETETRQNAYQAPGFYREITLDENGQVRDIEVTDAIHRKQMSLNLEKKKATLSTRVPPLRATRGPFVGFKEVMKKYDLEWVGNRNTATGEVNVFRTAFRDKHNNKNWSYDFWIDKKTKQLVALCVPGADIYDPEKDPERNNLPEKDWGTKTPLCYVQHDINFDTDLDESLFQLEPPEDYTVQNILRIPVTEKEMIDYLGILADFNNKTFPDRPYTPSIDRVNSVYDKTKGDRTAIEQKLLDTLDHYQHRNLNEMPVVYFIENNTVKGSFQYLGKGVELGDKNRIVCWYKIIDSNTYRAVYGDLSVKDVAPEDLPLSMGQ